MGKVGKKLLPHLPYLPHPPYLPHLPHLVKVSTLTRVPFTYSPNINSQLLSVPVSIGA